MHTRKQALRLAKQFRTCPPASLGGDPVHQKACLEHLARCPYCAEIDPEEFEHWESLARELIRLSGPAAKASSPLAGQFRPVQFTRACWRDGLWYRPPLVLVLGPSPLLPNAFLVAQTYHDTLLAGPGDLILTREDSLAGPLFIESWNIYPVEADSLGAALGTAKEPILDAVTTLQENPEAYPAEALMPRPLQPVDPRTVFRDLELAVARVFACSSTSLPGEEAEPGPMVLYPSFGALKQAIERAVPHARWSLPVSTTEEAMALLDFPLEELPLAADEHNLEQGIAGLFRVDQGQFQSIRPIVYSIFARSPDGGITGRVMGLPPDMDVSSLCGLLLDPEGHAVPARHTAWRPETGDFVLSFDTHGPLHGTLKMAVLYQTEEG